MAVSAIACVFALLPQSAFATSISLLQVRAQKSFETIRTGSCTESDGKQSYFLGNDYIELGITPLADFGTACAKPTGFFGAKGRSRVGMTAAYKGFGKGEPYIDYFLPGSPEERFALGYRTGSETGSVSGGSNALLQGKKDISITSMSLGVNSVEFVGQLGSALQISGKYTLLPGDKHFTSDIEIENIAGVTLYDVRYHRSFDPDNTVDAGGSYTTNNKIVSSIASGDKVTVVSATSPDGDAFKTKTGQRATIFFATTDPRAVAYVGGFSNDYGYSYSTAAAFSSPQAVGYSHSGDEAIQITFGLGEMVAGAKTSLSYSTSLDYVDTEDDIEDKAEDAAGGDVVSSSGDPHMVNVNGDAFDIYRTGVWEFVRIPREADSAMADFKMDANVTNMGASEDKCTKALYITRFTFGGKWLTSHAIDVRVINGKMRVSMGRLILTPSSKPRFTGSTPHGYVRVDMPTEDMVSVRVGSAMIAVGVDSKPIHSYLNMQAKGVASLGGKLGGLLGDDDHSWISMRPASCSDVYRGSHLNHAGSEDLLASRVHFS